MALRSNVLQEDDIMCQLYADTHSEVSHYTDDESSDSDTDISTNSSRKQLRCSVVVVTSDSETSTVGGKSSEPENSDERTCGVWYKSDKKQSNETFLGTTGLNIVIDNPQSVC